MRKPGNIEAGPQQENFTSKIKRPNSRASHFKYSIFMKSAFLFCAFVLLICVAAVSRAQTSAPPSTPDKIVYRDGNEIIWEHTTWDPSHSDPGKLIPHTHRYVEAGTGISYKQTENGPWLSSQDVINLLPDGTASATNAPCKAYWPADIYNDTVKLVTADGVALNFQPIALSYSTESNTVLIAVLTNSVGELVSSNEIVYPETFSGISADVAYVFRKSGLEQDIVIHSQLPAPEQYSMDSADPSLTVQLLTEFPDSPAPDQAVGALNREDGLRDTTLSWGSTRMKHGKAFLTGAGSELRPVSTYKSFIQLAGRNVLVEQIPLKNIAPQLSTLPPPPAALPGGSSGSNKGSSMRHLRLPPPHLARAPAKSLRLARADFKEKPGFLFDFVTVGPSATNWVFQGDTTFFVSSEFYLYGDTKFEGSVIKLNSDGLIEIDDNGSVDCETAPYRPCVLTSWRDSSLGQSVGSGSPNFEDVSEFLDFQATNNVTLHDLRFCYGFQAVEDDTEAEITLRDCQCHDVAVPLYGYNLALYNDLFGTSPDEMSGITGQECAQVFAEGPSLVAENVTADSGYAFIEDDSDIVPALTNCLITSEPIYSPGYGDRPVPATNSVVWLPSPSAPVYQSVNGGNYYLTNASPYRAAGTANIDPTLLANLQKKTTWAPILYNGVTFATNATFNPWAPRDTNSSPDIGYAYDPLDYIFENNCEMDSNATFTAGTAAAWTTSEGIQLEKELTVNFAGLVTSPDYWVRANTVQEDDPNGSYGAGGLVSEYSYGTLSAAPTAEASFTRFSMLAGYGNLFRDDNGELYINLKNCEFWDTGEGGYGIGLNLTNCLFYRTYIGVQSTGPAEMSMQNCTMYGGNILTAHWGSWTDTVVNCSFDGGADLSGVDSVTYCDYNAFDTNGSQFPTSGAHDVIVTNGFAWESGWFGNFYLPTNSPLIEAGSTNANFLGLYHFTTQTNQVPDGTNIVTIGYHYVATDLYGNPLDSNGDGIPDYLEDANGDGLFDGNDLADWQISPYGLNGQSAFEVFTPLK